MKITVLSTVIADALNQVSVFAGKSKSMPILDDVKVTTKDNRLKLQTTDGDNTIIKYLTAESVEPDTFDTFCVNCKDLVRFVTSLPSQPITLTVTQQSMIIKHSKGSATISVDKTEDFPEPVNAFKDDTAKKLTVPSTFFAEATTFARPYVSTDQLRPVMCGVYFYSEKAEGATDGVIGFCASDSRRLAASEMPMANVPDFAFVTPVPTLDAIKSVVKKSPFVEIVVTEKNLGFKVGDTILLTRVIEGKYPKFKSIIPKNQPITAEFDKTEMLAALNRVRFSDVSSGLVKIHMAGMNATISSDNIDLGKNAFEDVICTANGEITFGLRIEYFAEALKLTVSDRVVMKLTGPANAIMIEDDQRPNASHLLMPLALQS
jgi:DNA polymerase-3 subunit beta